MNTLQTLTNSVYTFTADLFSAPQPKPGIHPTTISTDHLMQESWKKVLEQTQESLPQTGAKSAFENEDRLLNKLYAGQDPTSKAIMKFANIIKSNSFRTPYTKAERESIEEQERVLDNILKKGIENTKSDDIDSLPATLNDLKSQMDKQLDLLVAEVERTRQEHILSSKIDPKAIDLAKERLAKLIFLADRDAAGTAANVNLDNPLIGNGTNDEPLTATLKNLDLLFDREIQRINNSIEKTIESHRRFQYQEPEAVSSIQIPIEIAKILLTSTGLLNLGLIGIIKRNFFGSQEPLKEHHRYIMTTLDDLCKYPDISNKIESTTKPNSPESDANNIIRITLKLPPDAQPTDVQTKIVTLASLLSDMRQGSVGSCFATSICILMMGALKGKVIADFGDILSKGKMSRANAKEHTEFVPVLDIGDSTCQTAITINRECVIVSGNLSVWESPGLVSACRQLGIHEGQNIATIKIAVASIFSSKSATSSQTITTSMEEIIVALATKQNALLSNLTEYQKQERIDLALTAFSAETNSTLLRAYESCLASMAEANSQGFVRKRILDAVSGVFRQRAPLERVNYNYYYTVQKEAQKVHEVFTNLFNGSMQIRYDEKENIEKDKTKPSTTGDGHSTEAGAFVIYRLNQGKDCLTARRVVDPKDFNTFVADTLKVTKEVVHKLTNNEVERAKFQLEIDRIQAYVTNPNFEFVRSCMRAYAPGIKDPDPVRTWRSIDNVPWRDATGNFNKPIFDISTGVNSGTPSSVRPRNATELLVATINFGREIQKERQFLENDLSNEKFMVNTSQHAFNLSLENSTISDAMKITTPMVDPRVWIQQKIISPSIQMKDYKLSPQQVALYGSIAGQVFLPKEMKSYFDSQFKLQAANATSIHAVSQIILRLVYSMTTQLTDAKRNWTVSTLTSILFSNILGDEIRSPLGKNAVLIADTNWVAKGQKNIYFGVYYNPVTDSLELGTVNEDGSELSSVRQDEWVSGTAWEMFKAELVPA